METTRDLGKPLDSHWIARPQKPRWVYPAMAVGYGFQIPIVFRLIFKGLVGETASWAIFTFGMILATLVPIVLAVRERRSRRMLIQDFALVDGAFGDQFPVQISVLIGNEQLGRDRGVLWFAEGLMGFSGAASSFVLAASDVSVPALTIPHAGAHEQDRKKFHPIVVTLKNASRATQMSVGPLGGSEVALHERLATFMAADERPEGERFWPPLVPYEAPANARRALS